MKPLSDQDHYEALEISRDAVPEAVERAYRLARATYGEDSLAGYSIVDDADASAIRERIETAYRVLSDADTRRAYDAALRAVEPPMEPELALDYAPPPVAPGAVPEEPTPIETFEEFEEEASGEFDGARLRRSRLRRGLELDDVAKVTKVNPTYLRFLEEERFEELPARVYVRGFVSLYSGCVGLDPKLVVDAYMRRFDQQGPNKGRRGFGR